MTNEPHQSSTIIAERFIDAIAKIKAEVARVQSKQKEKAEAEFEEMVSGYRKEIDRLKNQLEQQSKTHAEEIARITSDAEASIAKEKARVDEVVNELAKARAEVGEAITEQKGRIRRKNPLEQQSNAHIAEIAKIISDAEASIAEERIRADEAAEQLAKVKAEIARAITEQKETMNTEAEQEELIAGAEAVEGVNSETSEKTNEVDMNSSDNTVSIQ